MLAESLHRADLTAVEEVGGYAQLTGFDWTVEQIAARVGGPSGSGTAWRSLHCRSTYGKVAAGEWTWSRRRLRTSPTA